MTPVEVLIFYHTPLRIFVCVAQIAQIALPTIHPQTKLVGLKGQIQTQPRVTEHNNVDTISPAAKKTTNTNLSLSFLTINLTLDIRAVLFNQKGTKHDLKRVSMSTLVITCDLLKGLCSVYMQRPCAQLLVIADKCSLWGFIE